MYSWRAVGWGVTCHLLSKRMSLGTCGLVPTSAHITSPEHTRSLHHTHTHPLSPLHTHTPRIQNVIWMQSEGDALCSLWPFICQPFDTWASLGWWLRPPLTEVVIYSIHKAPNDPPVILQPPQMTDKQDKQTHTHTHKQTSINSRAGTAAALHSL